MVESAKKKLKKFILASLAKNGSFGVFFEKKGAKFVPLSWRPTCWRPVHVGARHVRIHLRLCAHSVRARQYSTIDHVRTHLRLCAHSVHTRQYSSIDHVRAHLSSDVEDTW
jgi:hypothetical protein